MLFVAVAGIASCVLVIVLHWRRAGEIDQSFLGFIAFFALVGIFGLAMRKWGPGWLDRAEERQKAMKPLIESRFYFGLCIALGAYLAVFVISCPQIRGIPPLFISFIGLIGYLFATILKDAREWVGKARTGTSPLDDERILSISRKATVHAFYITLAVLFASYGIANILAARGIPVAAGDVLGLTIGVAPYSTLLLYTHYAGEDFSLPRSGADVP